MQTGKGSIDDEVNQQRRVANAHAKARRIFRLRKPMGSRVPANSALYSRVLPIVIVVMAIVMALLILFAVGVLIGLVPFR